jgi:hypothetical protein
MNLCFYILAYISCCEWVGMAAFLLPVCYSLPASDGDGEVESSDAEVGGG